MLTQAATKITKAISVHPGLLSKGSLHRRDTSVVDVRVVGAYCLLETKFNIIFSQGRMSLDARTKNAL